MSSITASFRRISKTAMIQIIVASVIATTATAVTVLVLKIDGVDFKQDEPAAVYSSVAANDPVNIRKVSWWPYGTCYDVAYDPATQLLLIGSGCALLLLDVTDPSRPVKVNHLTLEGQHQHIALAEGIAYVTTYRKNGLQIIDVSDPSHLETIAFYPTEDTPHGIEIVGGIAYLAAFQSLDILDVSDPAAPAMRSRFPVGGGRAAHTYIRDDKLYLTVWSEGLYVLDISNPDSPVCLAFHSLPDIVLFAVSDNLALQTVLNDNTIKILDVSDDAEFNQISELDLMDEYSNPDGVVVDILFSDSIAFVSVEYYHHLQAVDLSDPYNPVIVSTANQDDSSLDPDPGHNYPGGGAIALAGGLLFQASWVNGAGIFDITAPESVHVVGNYDTPASYRDVSVSGQIACIANFTDGIRLLDVSNPLDIKEIGWLFTMGNFVEIVCDGAYAYAATEGWGVQIFDIDKPGSPHWIGWALTPGMARGVAVANGHAYIADSQGGLRIFDVAIPDSPVEVGFCLFSDSPTKVAVSGGYAYVGTADGRLQIVEITDPTAPKVASVYAVPVASSYITSLAVSGNDLYFGTNEGGMYRLDVSDHALPQLKSSLNFPDTGAVEDIAVFQGRAYAASEPFGLQAVDVTDPESMKMDGSYQTPGPGRGVFPTKGYIYFACDDGGLLVLRDNIVDMAGAIVSLKILSGMSPENVEFVADVNGDAKIGLSEVLNIFQNLAGLRETKSAL